MAFWNWRRAEPKALPRAIPASEPVEDVVSQMKDSPPVTPLCFVMLRAGVPETMTAFWSKYSEDGIGEEDLPVYLSREAAPEADETFAKTEILAVGDAAALWALLTNPRRSVTVHAPPYGLCVNYSLRRESEGYVRYSAGEIQRLGLSGLASGFTKRGELKDGRPERVRFPTCMVCGKPARHETVFHCISCDFVGLVHERCRPGAGIAGRSAFVIGGGGLRCPRCGATG